eukprot:Gb_25865 [translate_table: standard]
MCKSVQNSTGMAGLVKDFGGIPVTSNGLLTNDKVTLKHWWESPLGEGSQGRAVTSTFPLHQQSQANGSEAESPAKSDVTFGNNSISATDGLAVCQILTSVGRSCTDTIGGPYTSKLPKKPRSEATGSNPDLAFVAEIRQALYSAFKLARQGTLHAYWSLKVTRGTSMPSLTTSFGTSVDSFSVKLQLLQKLGCYSTMSANVSSFHPSTNIVGGLLSPIDNSALSSHVGVGQLSPNVVVVRRCQPTFIVGRQRRFSLSLHRCCQRGLASTDVGQASLASTSANRCSTASTTLMNKFLNVRTALTWRMYPFESCALQHLGLYHAISLSPSCLYLSCKKIHPDQTAKDKYIFKEMETSLVLLNQMASQKRDLQCMDDSSKCKTVASILKTQGVVNFNDLATQTGDCILQLIQNMLLEMPGKSGTCIMNDIAPTTDCIVERGPTFQLINHMTDNLAQIATFL